MYKKQSGIKLLSMVHMPWNQTKKIRYDKKNIVIKALHSLNPKDK